MEVGLSTPAFCSVRTSIDRNRQLTQHIWQHCGSVAFAEERRWPSLHDTPIVDRWNYFGSETQNSPGAQEGQEIPVMLLGNFSLTGQAWEKKSQSLGDLRDIGRGRANSLGRYRTFDSGPPVQLTTEAPTLRANGRRRKSGPSARELGQPVRNCSPVRSPRKNALPLKRIEARRTECRASGVHAALLRLAAGWPSRARQAPVEDCQHIQPLPASSPFHTHSLVSQ